MNSAHTSTTRRFFTNPIAIVASTALAVIALVALFGPLIYTVDPNRADAASVLVPPSTGHLLGTDSAGRDVLARLIAGASTTLIGAFITCSIAAVLGTVSGVVAGYARGWFDAAATWVTNVVFALPSLIVVLAVIPVIGTTNAAVMAAFGILFAPGVFRIARSATLSVRNELYVDAAKISGLRASRIIARHVVRVVRAPVIIQSSIIAGIAIGLQAGLGFLGVGDQTQTSWGAMLEDAFTSIYRSPITMIWPGLAISITVACLVLLGNALRDSTERIDPRRRRARVHRTSKNALPVPPPTAAVMSMRNLTISYEGSGTVVTDLNLDVRAGEVLALVGESGSGKSQTSLAMLGLLPDSATVESGRVWFDGALVYDAKAGIDRTGQLRGRHIGYIPQEPMSNLDPSHRVGRYLVDPIRRHLGLDREEAKARALDLLRQVGITDPDRVFHSYPHEISGGMAQRVLIAGAVSCEARLLIADEPTTALDVTVQADVLGVIRRLQQERELGVLFITHDFGVVADLADRVMVMHKGRVVEEADAHDLFREPKDEYTRMLLSSTLEHAVPRDRREAEMAELEPTEAIA